MSNLLKKARQQKAHNLLKKPESKFEPCDLNNASFIPKGMTKAFMNNRYVVMIYENVLTSHGFATRVMIQNHFNKPIENHWRVLQDIKNEIFGKETVAIEYFPAESQLEDNHNIYWLFIYPEGVLPIPF